LFFVLCGGKNRERFAEFGFGNFDFLEDFLVAQTLLLIERAFIILLLKFSFLAS
jgi:hypothetical protein